MTRGGHSDPPGAAGFAERSIGSVFAGCVALHGADTAIADGGRELDYRQLDSAANALARALGAVLTGRQQRVALLLDDRIAQVVAMLGVLKAGHVFVPLATTDPGERLAARIEHAQAGALVVERASAELASRMPGRLPQVAIDALDFGADVPAPEVAVEPGDLACLLYTSGSTGTPKGVLQSHRNILHHVAKYTASTGIGHGDRLTWLPGYTHAASISDVFPALLTGATLLPYSIAGRGLGELGGWLRAQRATVFHTVPAVFRQLVADTPAGTIFADLRLVRLAGEPLHYADLAGCRALFAPQCRVLNSLGTTEINLVRQYFVAWDARPGAATVPVGHAVADTQVLIVDERGEEVARGETGEIAVRSRYLSPGYWRDPELTRKRFVPDAADPQLRTYLTGDRGRMAEDGCLEHLGRLDARVKLHGQSIDLQEIEAALAALAPSAGVAVVDAADPGGGPDRWLVAFLAGCPPGGADIAALRAGLARTLPGHMTMMRFVCLEALPLAAGGKVDRPALRELAARQPVRRSAPWVAPDDHATFTLARLWEDLLDFRPVGLADDFFELGGDSLLALRMLTQAGRLYGRDVSPLEFVRQPTVAGLAALLRARAPDAGAVAAVALKTGGDRPPLFFLPGGTGSEFEVAFVYRELIERLGPDQPVYGLVTRNLDPAFGTLGVETLAAGFESVLRSVSASGPYYLAGDCVGGIIAFELARRLEQRGEHVAFLALLDTEFPESAPAAGRVVQRLRMKLGRRSAGLRLIAARAGHHLRQLTRQPPRAAWRYLREKLARARQLHGENTNTGAIQGHQGRYYEAIRRYRRPHACRARITLILSSGRDPAREASAWRDFAGAVETHSVPGDHHGYLHAHAQTTAACLMRCLDSTLAAHAPRAGGGQDHQPHAVASASA